jgi:hypothetical protein
MENNIWNNIWMIMTAINDLLHLNANVDARHIADIVVKIVKIVQTANVKSA